MFSIIRALIMLTGTVTGVTFGYFLGHDPAFVPDPADPGLLGDSPELILSVVIGMLGYLIASMITRELENKLHHIFRQVNFQEILAGTMGFLAGVLLANLTILLPMMIFINTTTVNLPEFLKPTIPVFKFFMPLIINLFMGYVGMSLVIRHRRDIFNLVGGRTIGENLQTGVVYLDTSILIDGRVLDIINTGFIEGQLLVPRFVLNELHILSDSNDELKRNRGRRGLHVVEEMKRLFPQRLEISNEDSIDVLTVDEKLIAVARRSGGAILTNDYNLNKVASIQSIRVLNVNDLIKALRPVVMPGEEMPIYILKKGKEAGQGVGYLPDGTMVVIEDGAAEVGTEVMTIVTSMIQTSAGRMIFTRINVDRNKVLDLNEKRHGSA